MYLKKIEISGFKSFAHRSVLDFGVLGASGITAVVGPNGSGKSNVADAIRWVTGEQSGKNLRSKRSEDVIFCGSSSKPRGSYAQVTLLLSDKKPFKFQINNKEYELIELEISRKLFRSGDSDYLINNKKVRLSDIQQLLASLGFGQSSYTVIGQGMVDRLLFFSPAERKVLFDEAAGVKQYEIKREQSIRKLESTDSNLIRLRDILSELEPRVVNLRRLVKRAEGRKELEAEILLVQQRYFGSLLHEYSGLVKDSEQKKLDIMAKITAIEENIQHLDLKSQETLDNPFRDERIDLERKISHESEKRDKLKEEVAYLRGQIESSKQNIERARIRKEQMGAEKNNLSSRLESLQAEINETRKQITFDNEKQIQAKTKLADMEMSIANLDQELANPKNDKDTERLAKLEAKQSALELEKQESNNRLYSIRQAAGFARAKKEQAERSLKIAQDQLISMEQSLFAAISQKDNLETQRKTVLSDMKKKEVALEKVATILGKSESDLHTLAQQVTESNLVELEGEIGKVSDNHRTLYSRIAAAKTAKDFDAIRKEFKDFGDNLTRMLDRFKTVTKAVNNKERERIENIVLEARSQSNVATKELQRLQFDLVRCESEIASLSEKIDDLNVRIKTKTKEITEIKIESDSDDSVSEKKLVADIDKATREIAELTAEIRKYSGAASERQNAILREKDAEQGRAREQRQVVHNLDLEISRRQSRLSSLENELANFAGRLLEIKSELETGVNTKEDTNESFVQNLKTKERELSRSEEDIAKLRGGLSQLVSKEREHEQNGYRIDREKRDLENSKLSLQGQLSSLEVDSAKATIRLEDVSEEIRVAGVDLTGEEKYHVLDQMEKDVLKLKIENFRRKLDTTASIDPETEAEYHELEERSTTLAAQVEDLTKAKDDLVKVVRELDERIKGQFAQVFKEIASEFNRYFTMLFSGGSAKLSLGENEEGSFGIEISANPPGKRIQSLSSLSGGERTLTSLALLFAILSVNPSPFVVLDEVDAALDESNTVRYVNILEDLAKKTQFIVISHNRDTMKSASLLYGVTMDESHVSKLLSVKLTEALVSSK